MKKLLLLLSSFLMFASCSQPNGAGNSILGCPPVQIGLIDASCMPLDTAKAMIKRYDDSTKSKDSIVLPGQMPRRMTFMLNASAIRQYLNKDTSIGKLDVYLTMTDSGMSAVYIGAVDSLGEWVEHPYYKSNDPGHLAPMVLDLTLPCPVCDKLGIHYMQNQSQNQKH